MNKKEIVIPLMVIGLTLLFAGICVAVFLTNGKSKKWVARKMKIGGMLLTLTAASCNGGGSGGDGVGGFSHNTRFGGEACACACTKEMRRKGSRAQSVSCKE